MASSRRFVPTSDNQKRRRSGRLVEPPARGRSPRTGEDTTRDARKDLQMAGKRLWALLRGRRPWRRSSVAAAEGASIPGTAAPRRRWR